MGQRVSPCLVSMEVDFGSRRRKFKTYYENHKEAVAEFGTEVAEGYVMAVQTLFDTRNQADLYKVPHLQFHPLKGSRKGQYAMTLAGRWRLVVHFYKLDELTVVNLDEINNHYGQ